MRDSLDGLINLQTLILGNKYGSDKPLSKLDNFLDSLINLQKIELYNYNNLVLYLFHSWYDLPLDNFIFKFN